MIYHCLYKNPIGNELKPTCVREVNGLTDTFLFAATHLSKAMAFSFSYHDGEIICNGGINETEDEFALVCGGQEALDKDRNIKIYGFSSEGFEEISGARQCVSTEPVAFKDTELVLETSDIKDLMRNGLQVFSIDEKIDELDVGKFMDHYNGLRGGLLYNLLKEGRARWINDENGINPNEKLKLEFANLDKFKEKNLNNLSL